MLNHSLGRLLAHVAILTSVAVRYRDCCPSHLEVIPTLSLMAGTVCSGPGREPVHGRCLINVAERPPGSVMRHFPLPRSKKCKCIDLPANADVEVCWPNKKALEEMGTQSGEKLMASTETLSPNQPGPTKTRHAALKYLGQGPAAWVCYFSILKKKME